MADLEWTVVDDDSDAPGTPIEPPESAPEEIGAPRSLRQAPVATTNSVRGLGIFLSRQDGYGTTPHVLGRKIVSSSTETPRMQFAVAELEGMSHALIHDATANTILRLEILPVADPSASVVEEYIPLATTTGRALAALGTAVGLYVAFSEATLADGLAIGLHRGTDSRVGTGPSLSGTALGFSAEEAQRCFFTGFAARLRSDGNVSILASVVDRTVSRSRPSSMAGYTVRHFILNPTGPLGPGAVVAPQMIVDVGLPFDVHAIAEGLSVPIDGSPQRRRIWAAGRCDPETWNPSSSSTVPEGREALHLHGAEGIWLCVDEDPEAMLTWERVYLSPIGVSHDVRGHVTTPGETTREHSMRDIGLTFDTAWQRLTILGIDTDSAQDPVLERPTYG